VLRVLERHPLVVTLKVEPFVIPYDLDGQRRRYVPDFFVIMEGGIHEVWEVKPKRFLKHPKNIAKIEALNAFVDSRGWNARIVSLADIEGMERSCGLRSPA